MDFCAAIGVAVTLGGLSGAIYNEVLQFFVIMAGLIPLPGSMRASSEPYAALLASTVRSRLGSTWGLSETGATGSRA